MWIYERKLQYPVRIKNPDRRFGSANIDTQMIEFHRQAPPFYQDKI